MIRAPWQMCTKDAKAHRFSGALHSNAVRGGDPHQQEGGKQKEARVPGGSIGRSSSGRLDQGTGGCPHLLSPPGSFPKHSQGGRLQSLLLPEISRLEACPASVVVR